MPSQLSTVGEFEEYYAANSGTTVEWLRSQGRWGEPCDCGEPDCRGWQMVHLPRDDWDWERIGYPRKEQVRE